MFLGLFDMVTREHIRNGDGEGMVRMWRLCLPMFWHGNHYNYMILRHRLLADTNGRLPARQANELIWNRTMNLRGGRGHNLEKDLVNEFFNKDFVGKLSSMHI